MTPHRTRPPTRAMRETPDIDQLKRQARELLEAYRAQSADAVIEVAAHHRTATPETFALHIVAQEEKRAAHGANAFGDGLGRLRHAMMTGGEEAVIAVFESVVAFGRWDYVASCPLDSLQGKGLLQAAVRNDRPAVLRHLLEMGLDPDERTQIGQHEDQSFSSGGPLLEAVNMLKHGGWIDAAAVGYLRNADLARRIRDGSGSCGVRCPGTRT